LGAIEQVFSFLTTGNIGGLPTWAVFLIMLVVGLIVGYLVHMFLKIAIIAAIILFVLAYFGFFGLSLSVLKNDAIQYGNIVYQYGALIIGILPLGIGFIIGVVIGFVLS
jgi:uncharacterized membrane protein (Fun14 family)